MSKKKTTPVKTAGPTFEDLVRSICEVDRDLAAQAKRAVNVSLTLRNWLIGCDIVEYEQRGADRASYGERLLAKLSARLVQDGVSRAEERELRRYRQFYQTYPQIREALTPELHKSLGLLALGLPDPIRESLTPEFEFSGRDVITRLSFTHFVELLAVEDPLKRTFYEAECIRGNWGVRELRRQIASLYFERSALSRDKEKLARISHAGADPAEPHLTIRDPYVFEFIGLKAREVMSESHLEDQLLDKLQEFLLELGHGFCFEARQKRILIGDSHGFIDLVFYHRILKCHVLIELKLAGVQPREHRPTEHLCELVRPEHEDRGRQPADWHPPLHAEGSRPGGIRPGRYGQPALRLEVSAPPAQARGTATRTGADAQGGRMSSLPPDIRELADAFVALTRRAVKEYSPIVDSIVRSRSTDVRHIEHTLDGLLGFCHDPEALLLYKKLCRHYDFIDPAATAAYVRFYREMWDSEPEVQP